MIHQCPKPAIFGSVLAPLPYVAFALANCRTGQPLKTTRGYVAVLPAITMVQFSLLVLLNLQSCYTNFITAYCRKYILCLLVYTVTRPYAGFRHPDQMVPDQMVREREMVALHGPENSYLI